MAIPFSAVINHLNPTLVAATIPPGMVSWVSSVDTIALSIGVGSLQIVVSCLQTVGAEMRNSETHLVISTTPHTYNKLDRRVIGASPSNSQFAISGFASLNGQSPATWSIRVNGLYEPAPPPDPTIPQGDVDVTAYSGFDATGPPVTTHTVSLQFPDRCACHGWPLSTFKFIRVDSFANFTNPPAPVGAIFQGTPRLPGHERGATAGPHIFDTGVFVCRCHGLSMEHFRISELIGAGA